MKKLLLSFLLLTPSMVHAAEYEHKGIKFEANTKLNAYYGYSATPDRYRVNNDYTRFIGNAEVNLSASKEGYSLHLDLMHGFNKLDRNYNNGIWGKEIYGVIDKDFGRIMIGETFNVADQFHQGPSGVNDIDISEYVVTPNWARGKNSVSYKTLDSTSISTDGVAPKITYITPEYKNTYLGFSYINNVNNRRGLSDRNLSYEGNSGYVSSIYNEYDLGFAEARTSISYAEFRKDDKEHAASLSLSKGGWTLSGGYRKAYIDGNMPNDIGDNYREGYAWDIGLGYEIGPFETELSYFNSKAKNTSNEDRIIQLSNNYSINKYAKVYLNIAYAEFIGEDKSVENNNKGFAFVTGLGLEF